MGKRLTLLLVVTLLAFPLVPARVARAIPPMPSTFWGTVKAGGVYVPAGTIISVWSGGTRWTNDDVRTVAYDTGTEIMILYTVDVQGDDPDTPGVIEGPTEGALLQFRIHLGPTPAEWALANETGVWHSNMTVQLNLTASEATPTPTLTPGGPTLTPTPTPSITPTPSATPPVVVTPTPTSGPTITAGEMTFKQGISPSAAYDGCQDTWIDGYDRSKIHGNDGGFTIKGDGNQRTLIYFDVSAIPLGANITVARLSAYCSGQYGNKNVTASAYGLKRQWTEQAATWINAAAGAPWSAMGANDTVGDRAAAPVSQVTLRYDDTGERYTWDVISLAQEWANNPAANHGVIIIGSGSTGAFQFLSSEASSQSLRPSLYVAWSGGQPPQPTVPGPTNTPGGPTATPSGDQLFAAIADSELDRYNPTKVHGGDGAMRLKGNGDFRPVVRFDTSSIPAGSHVYGATLQVYAYDKSSPAGGPYNITAGAYGLKRHWVENEATWQVASAGDYWGVVGADNTTTDRDGAPSGQTVLYSDKIRRWYTWDVTALAQRWVDDPSSNHGVLLKGDGGSASTYIIFYTINKGVPEHPRLRVLYSVATPTPTSTPQPSATPTHTPGPGTGTLQVIVYHDANHNGFRDPGEPGLNNVTIELRRDSLLVDARATGADGNCTFASIQAATYMVREIDPPGYISSTENEWPAYVAAGQTLTLFFGDYPGSATPTPTVHYTEFSWLPMLLK